MIRICSALSEAGHDCLLVGRMLPKSPAQTHRPFRQRRLKCWFTRGPFFYLEYNLRLSIFLLFQSFDTLHTVDADTAFAGSIVRRFKRFFWVYDAHEYFTEVPELQGRKRVRAIWSFVESRAFKRADVAITVSQTIAEIYEEMYQKSVHVIRNVPDLRSEGSAAVPNKPQGLPVLIYQGALNTGRCVEHYIRAMKDLDAKLLIAGEGDLSSQLRSISRSEGVSDKVEFLGRLDPEDLRDTTATAYLGLNILENKGLSYYYSLSNKTFDYMQAGIPQLCSPFPEYEKLNSEFRSMLFAEADPHDISEKVKLLLNDRSLYEELATNAEIAGNAWNWAKEKVKLLDIYER